MKVLMLNGSSKPNGNTFRSLVEVGEQLKKEGIDYEIFQTGAGPVRDCIGCGQCEKACPQHLPVRKYLDDVAAKFEA